LDCSAGQANKALAFRFFPRNLQLSPLLHWQQLPQPEKQTQQQTESANNDADDLQHHAAEIRPREHDPASRVIGSRPQTGDAHEEPARLLHGDTAQRHTHRRHAIDSSLRAKEIEAQPGRLSSCFLDDLKGKLAKLRPDPRYLDDKQELGGIINRKFLFFDQRTDGD
jgi:hypothetical protein